jgi:hypothetical protein
MRDLHAGLCVAALDRPAQPLNLLGDFAQQRADYLAHELFVIERDITQLGKVEN